MYIRMEWIYKTPKGTEMSCSSEELPAAHALLIVEDMERTGRLKNLTMIDRHDSSWTVKELKNYLKGIETDPHNVKVYFDGGFGLTSRTSGLGCVIYYEQSGKSFRLRRNVSANEHTSNNEAEYAALYLSIQELELLGVHHLPVKFIGDSQVVIKQMNEEWPTLEKDLSGWAERIDIKLKDLGIQAEYELVPRKLNGEADRLATQALNGIAIKAKSEVVGE